MRFLPLIALPFLLVQVSNPAVAAPVPGVGSVLKAMNPLNLFKYLPDIEHIDEAKLKEFIVVLVQTVKAGKALKSDYDEKKRLAELEKSEKIAGRSTGAKKSDLSDSVEMDDADYEQELDVDAPAPKVVLLTDAQAVQLRNNPEFQEAAHEYAESLREDAPRGVKSVRGTVSRKSPVTAAQLDDEEESFSLRPARMMGSIDEDDFPPSSAPVAKVRRTNRSDKVRAPVGLSQEVGAQPRGRVPKSTGKRQLRPVSPQDASPFVF